MSQNHHHLHRVRDLLQAKVLVGEDWLARPVDHVDATDMMSQVLAFSRPGSVLLTSLTNIQVVNTAEVAGVVAIVYVRSLKPPEEVLRRAEVHGIPVLSTPYSMYSACGRLYQNGLPGPDDR